MSVSLLTAPGGPRRRTSPDRMLRRRTRPAGPQARRLAVAAGRSPSPGPSSAARQDWPTADAPHAEPSAADGPHALRSAVDRPHAERSATEPPHTEPAAVAHDGPVSRAASLRARLAAGGASDAGMATAEYAIATVAAAGFAGLLLLILRSDEVRGLLLDIVRGALQV